MQATLRGIGRWGLVSMAADCLWPINIGDGERAKGAEPREVSMKTLSARVALFIGLHALFLAAVAGVFVRVIVAFRTREIFAGLARAF
jgi:hypothetical protein